MDALVTDIETETPQGWDFNPDSSWPAIVATYARTFTKIAHKLTTDEALREDCEQEMMVAALTVRPARIKGYDPRDTITPTHIPSRVDAYIRQSAKFAALAYLHSYKTGDWLSGRTEWGTKIKRGSRYVPLDGLLMSGDTPVMEIDEQGRLSRAPNELEDDSFTTTPNGAIVPEHARENENAIADRITLDDLLATLTPTERSVMQRARDGEELDTADRYRAKQLTHKLACQVGAEKVCTVCDAMLPAERYGWHQWEQAICLDCETPHQRYKRHEVERWLAAVGAEEQWHCKHCDTDKCATEFRPHNRTTCKACHKLRTPKAVPHQLAGCGTPASYKRRCGCEACRTAYISYRRDWYARKKAKAQALPEAA